MVMFKGINMLYLLSTLPLFLSNKILMIRLKLGPACLDSITWKRILMKTEPLAFFSWGESFLFLGNEKTRQSGEAFLRKGVLNGFSLNGVLGIFILPLRLYSPGDRKAVDKIFDLRH